MIKNKGKGFSIVYIPFRGSTRNYYIPSFVVYSFSLVLLLSAVLSWQFIQSFTQLRTEYIKMNSFSMEEKQLIMSEELFAVQQVIDEIYPLLESNREKMKYIAVEDQEVRQSLNLRALDLNPEKFTLQNTRDRKNLGLYGNPQLNLMNTFAMKDKAVDQSRKLDQRLENLQTAKEAGNIYLTRLAQTPDIWPVPGAISPGFGWRTHPIFRIPDFHTGVDITAARGLPIKAAADGRVIDAGWSGGYGRMVKIYHRDGISTLYAHCSEILVKPGDMVKKGSIIAKAGATGTATHSHLHYEVRLYDKAVDPEAFYREGRTSR
jgi:murein DD-endopeptidase MepM/ murein hydrolase activator NlpD